jgi:hypothetical protein
LEFSESISAATSTPDHSAWGAYGSHKQHIETGSLPSCLATEEKLKAIRGTSPGSVILAMDRVSKDLNAGAGVFSNYEGKVRKQYLVLNQVANEQYRDCVPGSTAPFNRPMPRLSKDDPKADIVSDYLNDRQVNDLHFFWCLGHRHCLHQDGAEALSAKQFDFQAAFKIAKFGGTFPKKLEDLGLDRTLGIQSLRFGASAIASAADKELRKRLFKDKPGIVQQLRNASTSNNANFDEWAELHAAGQAIRSARQTVTGPALVSMRAILFGRPTDHEPRQDVYLSKYRKACEHLGIEPPALRNSRSSHPG